MGIQSELIGDIRCPRRGRVFFESLVKSHRCERAIAKSKTKTKTGAETKTSPGYDHTPTYAASAALSPPAANTLAPPARTRTRVGPYGTRQLAGLPGRSETLFGSD